MTIILNKPIGIFGGTFDPVHKGHIDIANHILYQFNLARIEWIPCNQPAHRKEPDASATDRLHMLKLATDDNERFYVNDCEIKRGGVSYMIDTLKALRATQPKTPFCLILGADAFSKLNLWHQWESLLEYTHIIVINRANYILENIVWLKSLCDTHKTSHINDLHNTLTGKIYFETINPIAVSATHIRKQLANNQKPSGVLQKLVYNYIKKKGLYL